ncbi:hypothetical protein EV182_001588, partial [Spiromyces aspiralis]
MLYLWYFGNMLYGAFAVADHLLIGLIIQPQLFALFTLINLLQCYHYGYKWRPLAVALATIGLVTAYTALHVGIYYALKAPLDNGNNRIKTAMGVLPAVFIALGFFPQYYVSIKSRSVEMSNFFIALDISGGVFSTLSLAFGYEFDYVASITYLVVVLLDLVLLALKYLFKWTKRSRCQIVTKTADTDTLTVAESAMPKTGFLYD